MPTNKNIAIVGAGAAGCFCALNAARRLHGVRIIVLEGGGRALAKVSITGGGRCNLTNTFAEIRSLHEAYPRGDKLLKRLFNQFSPQQTFDWWEQEGVRLVTQEDECIFPQSQRAMEIVSTLLEGMRREGVELRTNHRVSDIEHLDNGRYRLTFENADLGCLLADSVVVTTGGSPKADGMNMLKSLGMELVAPHPSLFTFNVEGDIWGQLMGTVVNGVTVSLPGTKFKANGPLLITHWGMSGPAILKLSAHAAIYLAEKGYRHQLLVNWLGNEYNEESARALLTDMMHQHAARQVQTDYPTALVARHWSILLLRAGIDPHSRWAELNKKQLNKLAVTLTADPYQITGQSRHKEEFVTAGGVALTNMNPQTLECKSHPGLFFAGEVTDVDAITGGFNLQAAWTMGYVVAQNL